MLREIIRPTSKSYNIQIPEEYINTEVEILVLPFSNKKIKSNKENKELIAFSNHSANNIEDWLDDNEDKVWK